MSTKSPLATTALASLEAGHVLEAPLRRALAEKKSWQLACFTAFGLLLIVVVSLVELVSRSDVLLHVIELDRLGRPVYLGAPEALAAGDERFLIAELGEFVRQLRTVYADRRALFEDRKGAYAHLSGPVRSYLDRHFEDPENDPRLLAERLYREVRLDSILPLSESTWQIRWIEDEYQAATGKPLAAATWTAIVEVEIVPAETPSELLRNPLGLYITSLNWTRTHYEGAAS